MISGGKEKTAEKSRGFCRPTGSLTNSNKEKGPSERRKRIDEQGATSGSNAGVEQNTRTFSPPSGNGSNPRVLPASHPHNTTPWCCIDPSPCRIRAPPTCQKLRHGRAAPRGGHGRTKETHTPIFNYFSLCFFASIAFFPRPGTDERLFPATFQLPHTLVFVAFNRQDKETRMTSASSLVFRFHSRDCSPLSTKRRFVEV